MSGAFLVPSPDGNSYFYLKSDSPSSIFQAGKSGLGEEQVYSFQNPLLFPTSILPFADGSHLLVAAVPRSFATQIHFFKLDVLGHTVVELGSVSG